jgi:hypothetical protein
MRDINAIHVGWPLKNRCDGTRGKANKARLSKVLYLIDLTVHIDELRLRSS